jgi:predicted Zn-dependent protease
MKSISKIVILLIGLLLGTTALIAEESKSTTDPDPVLRSLQTEMARSKSQLKLENTPGPYFIEYRVVEMDDWEADAALGAVRVHTHSKARFLLVQVRLGDYKQDSSSTRGEGAVEWLPLDQDEQALRFQVWTATDKAYKQAAESLTEKQARLKQLTIDHPVDDFAHADPVQSIAPLVQMKVEIEPWLKMLRDASVLYKKDPKVQFLSAGLSFRTINRYYVNSEGSVVRGGEELYFMHISGSTQAEDAMRLERNATFTARSLAELPKPEEFVARAEKMIASMEKLRAAPLADEDYHGPVMLSADSAATVFDALIGENVLGQKPDLGQNARVRGQFASSYKTRVLPEFLSVADDPAMTEAAGKRLLGHYEVDDEGVRAQRVPLIEKGVLVNYLLGRQPIRDFPASNGHGRAGVPFAWPAPGLGNLVVRSSEPLAPEELKKKLLAMCKDRGLDYGYYVATMGGIRAPRLLYRVWVSDGHEELVRGGVFGDLDLRSMRSNIIAAGSDEYVENMAHPYPQSVVAPSVLFDDLEIKRQTSNKDKLPEYASPQEAQK